VRVIAGEFRGRRLAAPRGSGTRPTSDRVREATFNSLGSMGVVEDAVVLDAFAGSGALGIEALSRGAARCTFVERDRGALAALRANLAACGLGADRAAVVVGDGRTHATGSYDLALLDPPYTFDEWDDLLRPLDASVAVCETSRALTPPEGWRLARSKAYGGTVVNIVVNEAKAAAADTTTEAPA
jgi:16S rRNA (guanine966-N2)-methyltransferase